MGSAHARFRHLSHRDLAAGDAVTRALLTSRRPSFALAARRGDHL